MARLQELQYCCKIWKDYLKAIFSLKKGITMSKLVRLSMSIEKNLFDDFEKMVAGSGYENRSEFIRDMIREHSTRKEWKADKEVLGTITVVYDHHKRELSKRLTELQHKSHGIILASTHIHLDHSICAEMIMLRGKASEIRDVANHLKKQRGVFHASLMESSTGKTFSV